MFCNQLWELLGDQKRTCQIGASGGLYDSVETLRLALQGGQGSSCFRLHHGLNTVRFPLLEPADFFRIRFCQGFDLHLFDFSRDYDICVLAGLFARRPGFFGLGFGGIGLLKGLGGLNLFRGYGYSFGFRFLFPSCGIGLRHLDFRQVFTLGCGCLSTCNLNPSFALGFGRSDFTISFALGYAHLRFIDGSSGCFFTQCVDIAGFIGNVLDVDVDQLESDLLEFNLDPIGDFFDQKVPVRIDFLNIHGRDYHPHLAEYDVTGLFAYGLHVKTEQTLGRIFHDPGLRGNTNRKRGGSVYPDVLFGKGSGQGYVNGNGSEVEPLKILNDGPNESCSTVNAIRGTAPFGFTVNDQDFVGRTTLVSLYPKEKGTE